MRRITLKERSLSTSNMANTKKPVQSAGLHKYIATGGSAKGYKGTKGAEKAK